MPSSFVGYYLKSFGKIYILGRGHMPETAIADTIFGCPKPHLVFLRLAVFPCKKRLRGKIDTLSRQLTSHLGAAAIWHGSWLTQTSYHPFLRTPVR